MRIFLIGSRETGHSLELALKQQRHSIHRHFGEEEGFGEFSHYLDKCLALRQCDAVVILGDPYPSLERTLKTLRNYGGYNGCVLVCRSREFPFKENEVLAWGATAWFVSLSFIHQGEEIVRSLSSLVKCASPILPPKLERIPEMVVEKRETPSPVRITPSCETASQILDPILPSPTLEPKGVTMPTVAIIRRPAQPPTEETEEKHRTLPVPTARPAPSEPFVSKDELVALRQEFDERLRAQKQTFSERISTEQRTWQEIVEKQLRTMLPEILKVWSAELEKRLGVGIETRIQEVLQTSQMKNSVLAERFSKLEEDLRTIIEERLQELAKEVFTEHFTGLEEALRAVVDNQLRELGHVSDQRHAVLLQALEHVCNALLFGGDAIKRALEATRLPVGTGTARKEVSTAVRPVSTGSFPPSVIHANGSAQLDTKTRVLRFDDGLSLRASKQECFFLQYVLGGEGKRVPGSTMIGVRSPIAVARTLRSKMEAAKKGRAAYLQGNPDAYWWTSSHSP